MEHTHMAYFSAMTKLNRERTINFSPFYNSNHICDTVCFLIRNKYLNLAIYFIQLYYREFASKR